MRKFDYSFLARSSTISISCLQTYGYILEYKTRFEERFNRLDEKLSSLRQVAMVESVASSNEIEGIVTTPDRLKEIVKQGKAPITHNELEIANYKETLARIHDDHGRMDFNDRTLKDLYSTLMNEVRDDLGYKKRDNAIVSIDALGNREVRFSTVPSVDTESAMEQLFLAYADARDQLAVNELLLIPCAILDFLCIHPFADGNGRMSRLLTLLLLYKAGYDIGRYISIERVINDHKREYYEALEKSSEGWHEGTNDYSPFLEYMLYVVGICYGELNSRVFALTGKSVGVSARVYAEVVCAKDPISKREILERNDDLNESSVESVLARLQKEGKIEKVGSRINARYVALGPKK